jgi:hypothetical protein
MQRSSAKRLPMNEIESDHRNPGLSEGFQISAEPVVQTRRPPGKNGATKSATAEAWGAFEGDHLAVLARDPKTLFVYWDLNLARHLAAAGLDEGKIQLRVRNEEGSTETHAQVDPLSGYAFVEVAAAGSRYVCELGCLDGSAWRTLVRSEAVATPAASISADADADFATLPFHLSFQRLLDILRGSSNDRRTLTESVANMQSRARELQASMSDDEWSRLVGTAASSVAAEAGMGLTDVSPNEIAALLHTVRSDARRQMPTPEMRARWRQLGTDIGGSSWGSASSR